MNYKVKTINNISDKGLDILKNKGYAVGEEESEPDAIILRSHKLQMSEIPSSVKAIVRAGAGVNNIPVEECSKVGIPVFNTPGANANAVKEMVLAALLMSSRGIFDGVKFVHGIEDVSKENLKKLVLCVNFEQENSSSNRLLKIGLGFKKHNMFKD